jgi:hypothetical protein
VTNFLLWWLVGFGGPTLWGGLVPTHTHASPYITVPAAAPPCGRLGCSLVKDLALTRTA